MAKIRLRTATEGELLLFMGERGMRSVKVAETHYREGKLPVLMAVFPATMVLKLAQRLKVAGFNVQKVSDAETDFSNKICEGTIKVFGLEAGLTLDFFEVNPKFRKS